MSSTAEELSAQSESLRGAMSFFRLDAAGARAQAAGVVAAVPAAPAAKAAPSRSGGAPAAATGTPSGGLRDGGFDFDLGGSAEDELDAAFSRRSDTAA